MKVKFKKLNDNARMPEKAHPSDFGYDVYAVSEKEIAPNVWQYGLGFALQIERGDELIWENKLLPKMNSDELLRTKFCFDTAHSPLNFSIDFRPRSSIFKTGMSLCNAIGTGDENYTGEYKLNFYHLMPSMPRYKVGDKIAQCKIGIAFPMEFVEVEELNETDRGTNRFGSSDKQ